MPVYMIADIKVTDDKWVPGYAASVHELVHKHGGKYLARSGNVKTLEGKPLDTTPDRTCGISIGGSRQGLRHRSQIRSSRRGPTARQRKPLSADRQYRSGRNDRLFAQRLKTTAASLNPKRKDRTMPIKRYLIERHIPGVG